MLAVSKRERVKSSARLQQPHNGLNTRQRRTHFVRNVVQQVSFAFHQLLQLCRHFVELHTQIGQFVFTVVQLL